MTRREPDWADEAASLMTPWPLDMRTMTVTLTSRAVYDFRDTIAAALRAERERCAGICDTFQQQAKADVERCTDDQDKRESWAHFWAASTIRKRIRAGDQP